MDELITTDFSALDWAIVPGPERLTTSTMMSDQVYDDLAEYSPHLAATAALQHDAVSLAHDGDGDFWNWRAKYSDTSGSIVISMTLFDTEPPLWGGFELAGETSPKCLLELYDHLRRRMPSIYLHSSDAILFTRPGFVEAYG